jgi:hypothetical protein
MVLLFTTQQAERDDGQVLNTEGLRAYLGGIREHHPGNGFLLTKSSAISSIVTKRTPGCACM